MLFALSLLPNRNHLHPCCLRRGRSHWREGGRGAAGEEEGEEPPERICWRGGARSAGEEEDLLLCTLSLVRSQGPERKEGSRVDLMLCFSLFLSLPSYLLGVGAKINSVSRPDREFPPGKSAPLPGIHKASYLH